jgi:acetylornithine deacetylase
LAPEIELLADLVTTASVSGTEAALAAKITAMVEGWGLDVTCDEASVTVQVRGSEPGPTLALISHIDTVPAGEGWTRPPFEATIEGDRLYGRGSGDAKASVAAMLCAARDCHASGLARGRLLVILGFGEETKDTTMGLAVQYCGGVDAAIIGEPTNLQFAVAQRGLMMVNLVAHGQQRHAGYASADPGFTNAAVALAKDLVKLDALFTARPHPILGQPFVTPTMLEAGVSRNVTPPSAKAVLDVRSTPAWGHAEMAAVMRAELHSDVEVTSDRLVPCETPAGSALLAAMQRARPEGRCYGSPTCSDWVFVRDRDAVKCGPGTSPRSHTPDEYVDLPEVTAARVFYAQVAREYLA